MNHCCCDSCRCQLQQLQHRLRLLLLLLQKKKHALCIRQLPPSCSSHSCMQRHKAGGRNISICKPVVRAYANDASVRCDRSACCPVLQVCKTSSSPETCPGKGSAGKLLTSPTHTIRRISNSNEQARCYTSNAVSAQRNTASIEAHSLPNHTQHVMHSSAARTCTCAAAQHAAQHVAHHAAWYDTHLNLRDSW